MVYQDAARIFAQFRHYDEALKSLDQLLKQPLSPAQRESILHQYEAYVLALQPESQRQKTEDENEWLPDTLVTKHSGARKKTKGKASGKKSRGKNKPNRGKQTPSSEESREIKTETKEQNQSSKTDLEPADVTSKTSGTASALRESEVSSKPASKQMASASPKKAVLKPELYLPEGGWLPDGHPEVSKFYREINSARGTCDLEQEANIISYWLQSSKHKPIYGRICEEAAWFYIRQLESPYPSLYTLKGETVDKRRDMTKLAGQWLSKTEACYFQTPRGSGNNPEELEKLIDATYANHTDWAENSQYRKRIRCICSSRGHLYSILSAYVTGSRYNWAHHKKLKERYQAFYHLKNVADPGYLKTIEQLSGLQLT
ncbi:hypothetical protein [Endozoicomonas montiporae]|uniref:hypothetical protein n=1 Tax=Endozoicomonas montiporae TaxID=1027273 RepID=UPI0011A83600|nr:hypothetical protein [Endozoicomonas montiporae]